MKLESLSEGLSARTSRPQGFSLTSWLAVNLDMTDGVRYFSVMIRTLHNRLSTPSTSDDVTSMTFLPLTV